MKNIKKFLIVGALILTIGAGSLMAYADSPINIPNNSRMPAFDMEERDEWIRERKEFSLEDREEWFQERNEFRKNEIQKALKNGQITEAEAKEWEEHFNYMEEFQNKNRLNNDGFMGRGHGPCGSGMGPGMGRGRGMGMMRGNSFRY